MFARRPSGGCSSGYARSVPTVDELSGWPAGRLLSTAARLVEHRWNEHLARFNLTHAGLLALHTLGDGAQTQRALAASSQVEEQTMRTTVDRLERIGFVTRARSATDRRQLMICTTASGRRAYADALAGDTADRLVDDAVSDPAQFRRLLIELVDRLITDRGGAPF